LAGGIVEEHGRDVVRAFELRVTLLQVGLVLVRGQGFGAAEVAVVGDQRPAAVAGGVARDGVVVEAPADDEGVALDLAVAGVLSGSAALLLPDRLEGVRVGRDAMAIPAYPAGRSGVMRPLGPGYNSNPRRVGALKHPETCGKRVEGLEVLIFAPIPMLAVVLLVMGIAFLAGTIPARRAARQNPIAALRYE
jgi:hypothetical protein